MKSKFKTKIDYADVSNEGHERRLISNGLDFYSRYQEELVEVFHSLGNTIVSHQCKSFLDYGAGDGRAVEFFKKKFQRIFAYEPVFHQFEKLQYRFTYSDPNVEASNDLSSLFWRHNEPEKFDFVLCANVLGHVNARDADTIVQDLERFSTVKGVVAVIVSYTESLHDRYIFGHNHDLSNTGKFKDLKAFEKGLLDPNILCTRHFSKRSLEKLFHQFTIIDLIQFHRLVPSQMDPKEYFEIIKNGISCDALLILKKR